MTTSSGSPSPAPLGQFYEFLSMLGHELRNPLSPILTATQLMRMRGEDVFAKERTVIERQVQRMINLVDELLDVARLTRGKVELQQRPIEISEVIAAAVEANRSSLTDRSHRLTLDVPSTGMIVNGDPARLAQVFGNVLSNAAKFTPHAGSIDVIATATDTAISVSIRDTGIGIEPDQLDRIFEPFSNNRHSTDRSCSGLGLGLAIAKTLVDLHGGSIAAHSAGSCEGSEVVVELPRHGIPRSATRATGSGAFALPQLRPFRVLVVDDNEDAAFLFSEALRKLGHHVEVAHDGRSALALAEQTVPEIAFLDIGLPEMDGHELGQRLKQLGADLKLVAITGYGHSSDRARSHEAGFDLHLVKPVDLASIQDALAKLSTSAS